MSGRRAVQSCGCLVESYGEDVGIEPCILTVSGHKQVPEPIDNRISNDTVGQGRSGEQDSASGAQFGDHETKPRGARETRPGHKDVSRRIGDDLSSGWNCSSPDLGAGGMDFRGFNK